MFFQSIEGMNYGVERERENAWVGVGVGFRKSNGILNKAKSLLAGFSTFSLGFLAVTIVHSYHS